MSSASHEENAAVGQHSASGGLTRRSVELVVAVCLTVLAIVLALDNLKIGAGWGDDGPQAGYFPLRIAIGVALCGVGVFWNAFRERSDELFVTWEQLRRVMQVLVPLLVYVAAIPWLGIYVASTIFIACFMKFAGHYPLWKSVLTAVITNVAMFYIFEMQFAVPLPKGPLEAWFGY